MDVIVSEWMGYALFFESMLGSVSWQRLVRAAAQTRALPPACARELQSYVTT